MFDYWKNLKNTESAQLCKTWLAELWAGLLKIIPVGVTTYVGVKTGF